MKNRKQILIIVLTVLLVAIPVAAQTDDASPEMAGEVEGIDTLTITGQIANGTYGAETPGILLGMLHVLDANFNGRDMVHGVADDQQDVASGQGYRQQTRTQKDRDIRTSAGCHRLLRARPDRLVRRRTPQ